MKQASNYLNEASQGKYGEEIAEKIQQRIDWVAKEVEGKRILDIGCNQGEVSILLGRAGKRVTAIDISGEAVSYAKQSLAKETREVQQNVSFQQLDILKEPLEEKNFDTIILSEVLEQYESAEEMLEKAFQLVKKNGKVIVTVPFGINQFSDQKRTFYFQDIYQEVKRLFKVEEIDFPGASVGLVGIHTTNRNRGPVPIRFIKRLEEAFYQLESDLRAENADQEKAIEELEQEKKQIEAEWLAVRDSIKEDKAEDNGKLVRLSSKETDSNPEKELMEINQELREQLAQSTSLNKHWEKELKGLHADLKAFDQKWARRFTMAKKQYQILISGYRLYVRLLKKK